MSGGAENILQNHAAVINKIHELTSSFWLFGNSRNEYFTTHSDEKRNSNFFEISIIADRDDKIPSAEFYIIQGIGKKKKDT